MKHDIYQGDYFNMVKQKYGINRDVREAAWISDFNFRFPKLEGQVYGIEFMRIPVHCFGQGYILV